MSDDNKILPIHPALGAALDPIVLEQMDHSCRLALQKQLNKNERTPTLKALADKWKTMDRFSKRELGGHDVKPPSQTSTNPPPVTAQLAPGQTATVVGPSTIYGGNVEMDQPPGANVKK